MITRRLASVLAITVPLMAALFLSSIWGMTIYAGGGHTAGLAVGAMGAVWGGPGFGLLAATMVIEYQAEHE